MTEGEVKQSEEHWEVVGDDDSKCNRDPGELDFLEKEALFWGRRLNH